MLYPLSYEGGWGPPSVAGGAGGAGGELHDSGGPALARVRGGTRPPRITAASERDQRPQLGWPVQVLVTLDLLGIGVFAASVALAAVRARLDVFGVTALSVITALSDGILRDVLLGITPPVTLRSWPYLFVPALTALVVFRFPPAFVRLRRAVLPADAVGLALFTTAGTSIALVAGVPAVTSCLIGVTTGIGGGVLRDLLLRQVPIVLRRDVYALAALCGAVVVAVGDRLALPAGAVALVGATSVMALRVSALHRRWNAPVPG